jgi:Kef-type K+ transport system membrane component KefB
VLGFALSLTLFGAAFTEWIGVHAIFGSFLVGIAIGDSSHLREQIRAVINQFVSFIFAPLFFASIGLKLNYAANFDWLLTLIVVVIACVGKILGCGVAARSSGMAAAEAWAIGFGMNARGAMEIILALLALQYGVISERVFVALVVLALVTSMMSGPMIQRALRSGGAGFSSANALERKRRAANV